MTRTWTEAVGTALGSALCAIAGRQLFARRQTPCGGHDDRMRLQLMSDCIGEIEKSTARIAELYSMEKTDYDPIVRWVQNKDDHIAKFTDIVTRYFLAQRIKAADEDDRQAYTAYVRRVTLLHKMLIVVNRSRRSTDPTHVAELQALLRDFTTSFTELPQEGETRPPDPVCGI